MGKNCTYNNSVVLNIYKIRTNGKKVTSTNPYFLKCGKLAYNESIALAS